MNLLSKGFCVRSSIQEIISLEHNGITSPSINLNKFDRGIYNVTLSYENKVSVQSVILE